LIFLGGLKATEIDFLPGGLNLNCGRLQPAAENSIPAGFSLRQTFINCGRLQPAKENSIPAGFSLRQTFINCGRLQPAEENSIAAGFSLRQTFINSRRLQPAAAVVLPRILIFGRWIPKNDDT